MVRKHERLMTFIGAAILFATFLTKDWKQEQTKDLVAEIDKAREIYVLRTDLQSVHHQVTLLDDTVQQGVKHATDSGSVASEIDWELTYDQMSIVHFETTSNNLREFAKKLNLRSYMKELSDLQQSNVTRHKQLDSLQAEWYIQRIDDSLKDLNSETLDASMNSFLRSLSEAGINVHDIKRRMKKEQQQSEQLKQDSLSVVLDRIHSLRYSFEGIDDKYDGLTLRMLQEADEIKDRQSVQLSYYNRLAIVLYCLGLSLGLIGKLIGVNAGGGD